MDYVWDETREDILFWGTQSDLDNLNTAVSNCLKVVNESTNVREMVMETWLAVDYALRKFLLAGFELSRFNDEDFELEYELLPNSFNNLLQLFQTTLKHNRKFSLDPEPKVPDEVGGFQSSYEFWSYIKDNHPKLIQEIKQVTNEYRLEKNPELKKLSQGTEFFFQEAPNQVKERMNLGWRRLANRFDDKWIKKATKLNKARNEAAHSYDTSKICNRLGIAGEKSLELTRMECKQLLNVLLGTLG